MKEGNEEENSPLFQISFVSNEFVLIISSTDRLCGLVVRVPGYRSRGSGLDSRRYQIF
jgi:hypothetical protein